MSGIPRICPSYTVAASCTPPTDCEGRRPYSEDSTLSENFLADEKQPDHPLHWYDICRSAFTKPSLQHRGTDIGPVRRAKGMPSYSAIAFNKASFASE